MRNRCRDRNQQGGFTLLELLMVVIIIAILAAIALPQFLRAAEKSRASEALSVLGAMRSSASRYLAGDNGAPPSYPLAVAPGLCGIDIDPPGCQNGAVDPAWVAGTPAYSLWVYTLPAGPCILGGGCDLVATRTGGVAAAGTIQIDLDTGVTCADTAANASLWGVGLPGC